MLFDGAPQDIYIYIYIFFGGGGFQVMDINLYFIVTYCRSEETNLSDSPSGFLWFFCFLFIYLLEAYSRIVKVDSCSYCKYQLSYLSVGVYRLSTFCFTSSDFVY
jgi:hypothetical protein